MTELSDIDRLRKGKRYCVILAINIIMMFLIQREIL